MDRGTEGQREAGLRWQGPWRAQEETTARPQEPLPDGPGAACSVHRHVDNSATTEHGTPGRKPWEQVGRGLIPRHAAALTDPWAAEQRLHVAGMRQEEARAVRPRQARRETGSTHVARAHARFHSWPRRRHRFGKPRCGNVPKGACAVVTAALRTVD